MFGTYKFFKWFFGWDYVLWENSCSAGTSRVKLDGDKVAYYRSFTYGITVINNSNEVIWLTCPSENYIKSKTSCQGTNCRAVEGAGHSDECIAEHKEQ